MLYHSLLEFNIITLSHPLFYYCDNWQEWIIKTVHAVSSKFEGNVVTSKFVSKVVVSILKKNLIAISKGTIIKRLSERGEFLERLNS